MSDYLRVCLVILSLWFPSKVWGKYCEGGHFCTPPKDCCLQGCCFVYIAPGQQNKTPTTTDQNVLTWILKEHWYFWVSALVCVVVFCSCSLWNRRHAICGWICWRLRSQRAGISDRDSAGSCYLPPQYSRCSSFHHAPPPYTEVTSKPDLYPLVITYGDNADKGGASYLMVHYFRNYIIRPSGSLSATSTADSLSSSFICNASNEANSIIPPPYSSTGNFDEYRNATSATSSQRQAMLRSISSLTCPQQQTARSAMRQSASTQFRNPIIRSSDSNFSIPTTAIRAPTREPSEEGDVFYSEPHCINVCTPRVSDRPRKKLQSQNRVTPTNDSYADGTSTTDTPCHHFIYNNCKPAPSRLAVPPNSLTHDNQAHKYQVWANNAGSSQPKTPFHRRYDLESPLEPNALCQIGEDYRSSIDTGSRICSDFSLHPNLEELRTSYISITGSEVSSLANNSTPNSPPRATSPTTNQPAQCDFISEVYSTDTNKTKRYFGKSRKSSLYMPLSLASNSKTFVPGKLSPTASMAARCSAPRRSWLSRSAPTTPCGNGLVPNILSVSQKRTSSTSSKNAEEDSPLLTEQDCNDDQQHVDF